VKDITIFTVTIVRQAGEPASVEFLHGRSPAIRGRFGDHIIKGDRNDAHQ
jgi:hypothetical protein